MRYQIWERLRQVFVPPWGPVYCWLLHRISLHAHINLSLSLSLSLPDSHSLYSSRSRMHRCTIQHGFLPNIQSSKSNLSSYLLVSYWQKCSFWRLADIMDIYILIFLGLKIAPRSKTKWAQLGERSWVSHWLSLAGSSVPTRQQRWGVVSSS